MKLIIVIGLAVLDSLMLLTVQCRLQFLLKGGGHTIGQRVVRRALDLRLRHLCQILVRKFMLNSYICNVNSLVCVLQKFSPFN